MLLEHTISQKNQEYRKAKIGELGIEKINVAIYLQVSNLLSNYFNPFIIVVRLI